MADMEAVESTSKQGREEAKSEEISAAMDQDEALVANKPKNKKANQPGAAAPELDRKAFLASLPKKKSSVRLKEKRMRDRQRLRKLVTPKHALLAIHEMKGVTMSDFTYTQISSNPKPIFLATATINGITYNGEGPSKVSAKNEVCEQGLRDIMLAKMQLAQIRADTGTEAEENPENEVPIVTLVSFALHKLFADWDVKGYPVPASSAKSTPSATVGSASPLRIETATASTSTAPASSVDPDGKS